MKRGLEEDVDIELDGDIFDKFSSKIEEISKDDKFKS